MGRRLVDQYDLVIFDLDGVVYLVDQPIPGAVEAIGRLRDEGRRVAYATNNASRSAPAVAELMLGMGIPAGADEVLTSAQASAAMLAERFPAGAPILVIGADALRAEVEDAGLSVVRSADDDPVAVVQGYGPGVGWADLAEACVAVRAGAQWVATNADRTLPTSRGPMPGNGAMVAALATALDRQPDVIVGKPGPELFQTAARRAGAQRAIVVGDRLDTDIEGAIEAGMDSLLVLTGIHRAQQVLAAPTHRRPTHVAVDLSGLFADEDEVRVPEAAPPTEPTGTGGWRVTRDGARLILDGEGEPTAALRALCRPFWAALDGGVPTGGAVAASRAAAAALRTLDL